MFSLMPITVPAARPEVLDEWELTMSGTRQRTVVAAWHSAGMTPFREPTPFREALAVTRRYTMMPSPIGDLTLIGDGESLTAVYIGAKHRHAPPVDDAWIRDDAAFDEPRRQLEEYFDGRRREFDLPLAPTGTKFQMGVWAALYEIPYGETTSYGELAAGIGHPNGSRAVGAANGRNPISIIVPCHRVIGAGGALVGYGGGLPTKRILLDLEQRDRALFTV
jgi:methylated-DNA-[protein]-cysteine S-methyltransferase